MCNRLSMDWTELTVFKGIDLNDSFILSWNQTSDKVEINLEASIWPQSAYYIKPKSNEHTCYRRATLTILGAVRVTGLLPMDTVKPTTDPDGTKDYGSIDSLTQSPNGYCIAGEFGLVQISGGKLEFKINT
jgi:hypothetical protein